MIAMRNVNSISGGEIALKSHDPTQTTAPFFAAVIRLKNAPHSPLIVARFGRSRGELRQFGPLSPQNHTILLTHPPVICLPHGIAIWFLLNCSTDP
jgi:hypothetical protein